MKSMTAYAYVRKTRGKENVELIAKSLNSKYLDINIYHLPPEKVFLEKRIKKKIQEKLFRGRIEIYVFIKSPIEEKAIINKNLLYDYFGQINKLSNWLKIDKDVRMKDLLHLPGLITLKSVRKISDNLILQAAQTAVDRIVQFREKEGEAIKKKILKHIKKLKGIVEKIKTLKPKSKQRELGKEDIDEEVALISFYVRKLERLLNTKGNFPRGKTIDFLAQEMLKELNTCVSKTKKVKLASLIVEGKNYSERIREQAQNVE